MSPRMHMLGSSPERSLCGWSVTRVTDHAEAVTCRSCIRRMPGMPVPQAQWSWEAIVEYVLGVVAGPVVEPYPALTRDEWPLMRCRYGGAPVDRCGCAFCTWERRYRARCDEWARSQSVRPHRKYEAPFGSLNAALAFLVRWRRDGAALRSYQGPLQDRAVQVLELGAEVQTTARADRESLEQLRAGYAAIIEREVLLAGADEGHARAAEVLLASADESDRRDPEAWAAELELTERAYRALLSRMRKAVTIELAARGLVPEPRERVGVRREIAARRKELEARCV